MSTYKKNLIFLFLLGLLVCPVVSYAQTGWSDSLNLNQATNISGPSLSDDKNDVFVGEGVKPTSDDLFKKASLGTNNGAGTSTTTCSNEFTTFADFLNFISCIINSALIQIAITLALVYFMWGVVQYVLSSDSAEERKKSKEVMFWGVISMFVIVSVWGIVLAFKKLFGF